jgi:hypothetical protein
MAGPHNPQQAQVTMVFGGTAMPQGGVCTLGFLTTEAQFTSDMLDELVPILRPLHTATSCDNCVLQRVELKRGPNDTGPTWSANVNQNGSRGAGAISPNVAVLVHKQLLDTSARFGGRLFWPSPPEVVIDQGGNLTTDYVNDVDEAWADFQVAADLKSFHPCILHGESSIDRDYSLIDKFTCSPIVATQRRRLRR